MNQASPTNTPGYFSIYTQHVAQSSPLDAFEQQQPILDQFFQSFNPEQALYSYAPGKWTIQSMWQHITDCERIFAYRALCISRGEAQVLPAFDENDYAQEAAADERTWASVQLEWMDLRNSTKSLFAGFSAAQLARTGRFSSHEASVNTLGLILAGHVYHHLNVLRERYGVQI